MERGIWKLGTNQMPTSPWSVLIVAESRGNAGELGQDRWSRVPNPRQKSGNDDAKEILLGGTRKNRIGRGRGESGSVTKLWPGPMALPGAKAPLLIETSNSPSLVT